MDQRPVLSGFDLRDCATGSFAARTSRCSNDLHAFSFVHPLPSRLEIVKPSSHPVRRPVQRLVLSTAACIQPRIGDIENETTPVGLPTNTNAGIPLSRLITSSRLPPSPYFRP
jgi:hypothetical protein